jgi:hypothetical protein
MVWGEKGGGEEKGKEESGEGLKVEFERDNINLT